VENLFISKLFGYQKVSRIFLKTKIFWCFRNHWRCFASKNKINR